MGICWYCYWGWPVEVAAIYKKYIRLVGTSAMHYGPAHIIWEDENFERHHVQWCIDHGLDYPRDLTDEQNRLVIESLKELLLLPDNILCAQPEDYDDEHPENYPPKVKVETRPYGDD